MDKMKNESLKELKKIYNGSVFQFVSSKSSSKSVDKICNATSLSGQLTSEKIIREVRKQ